MRDYRFCEDNSDGKHGPIVAADDQTDCAEGFVRIQCDACGTTTGIPLPPYERIEWN